MCAKKAKSSTRNQKTKKSVASSSQKRAEHTSAQKGNPVSQVFARNTTSSVELPFSRKNYILLLIGVGLIAFGFFLMSLDDFVDASKFSISLYIAPPIVVAGFLEIIYAIMYKDTSTALSED